MSVGFGVAFTLHKFDFFGIHCNQRKAEYINWKLNCGSGPVIDKRAYGKLKVELTDLIQSKIKQKEILTASIYFRDLQDGPTLGINEHEAFAPASLLKLPLLITYLDLYEDNPDILERKLAFRLTGQDKNKTIAVEQTIPLAAQLKENTPYTLSDLLEHMIIYSDNEAYLGLLRYLNKISPDKNLVRETLKNLGIIDPNNPLDNTLSVKSYASIFFQLYNTSYFSRDETSEKALALLAKADFDRGIKAGIPAGIEVAHKFGERASTENNLQQLHDCGIVYYPGNPYLLCVMTRSTDSTKSSNFISLVSKMVYEEFDSRKL